uniref:hypothetical protein n=1 Tax=Gongronella sp. w5 TaxID=483437 RepID=UPI00218204B9|nr:hypothetical protein N4M50_mgp03 [Gongronella sp. w5]
MSPRGTSLGSDLPGSTWWGKNMLSITKLNLRTKGLRNFITKTQTSGGQGLSDQPNKSWLGIVSNILLLFSLEWFFWDLFKIFIIILFIVKVILNYKFLFI